MTHPVTPAAASSENSVVDPFAMLSEATASSVGQKHATNSPPSANNTHAPHSAGTTASPSVTAPHIELRDVSVALRSDGREVKSVYLAPDKVALPFEVRDGYVHTVVPRVDGYAMVVFEE